MSIIRIHGAKQNNLKDISVRIPKHAMTVVTGVAGSGKSTLIHGGLQNNKDAIIIDQKPVHASSRSHLLTYLDIFDDVRTYFSK
ncbi:ATP-binding cassette domain-containing protein, partial [Mesorhizobium sp. M2D.F.Ca.ET.153.01.1.1]